jgi:type II secretory ATPase GspE/PulE/Tfp pilus assembly ATPase PilB-like protein
MQHVAADSTTDKASEDQLALANALRGELGAPILGADTPFHDHPSWISVISVFRSGEIFIALKHQDDHTGINARAIMTRFLAERHRAAALGPYYVKISEIEALNQIAETAKTGQNQVTETNRITQFFHLVNQAIGKGATDIHFIRDPQGARTEIRLDKMLRLQSEESAVNIEYMISAAMTHANQTDATIIARGVQEGYIDNDKGMMPQDVVGLRLTKIPTVDGNYLAARIQRRGLAQTLDRLGLHETHINDILHCVARPNGMMIITAPLNNGKSTLLRACGAIIANGIKSNGREIHPRRTLSVEQPVEGEIPGVIQCNVENSQVEERRNEIYNNFLRGLLRSDAECILVGEIRDRTTAEIAYEGVVSGLLIWATLHTQSTYGSLDRLRDLQIPKWLYANPDYTAGLIAMRLTPTLCPECSEPDIDPPKATMEIFRLAGIDLADAELKRARKTPLASCTTCKGIGRTGLTLTAETLIPDDEFFHLAGHENPTEGKRRAMAHWRNKLDGMPMLKHALLHAARGAISLGDIERMIVRVHPDSLYRDS